MAHMSNLLEQTRSILCPGMTIPPEMVQLYEWIEQNGNITNEVGHLGDDCPTMIEFAPEGNVNLHYWLGYDDPEVINRLCVFCQTGGDGSMGAFWLDPEGNQKIVNMGSGSGSTMACVLCDSFADFLRLLALGYDYIGWDDDIEDTPPSDASANPCAFREWVVNDLGLELPATGTDIVKTIAQIGDRGSVDPFNRWLEENER